MAVRGGTPPGMQGIRPGSPAAIAAGYKPPGSKSKAKRKPPVRKPVQTKPSASLPPLAPIPGARPGESSVPLALPPIPTAAPVTITAVTAVPGVPTSAWWQSQYTSDPRYLAQSGGLASELVGTETKYGLVINRVADTTSPYYGRTIFRTGNQAGGAGTYVQDFDPATGRPVYRDLTTGEIVTIDPQTLMLDVRQVRPDEAGYLSGALGRTTAESAGRQLKVGEQAAAAGAQFSGMRAVGSSAESQALQSELSRLAVESGQSLTDTQRRYMELYNEIYQDLLKNPPAPPPSTTAITSITAAAPPPPSPESPSLAVPEVPAGSPGGGGAQYSAGAQTQRVDVDRGGVVVPAARISEMRNILVRNVPPGGWREGAIVTSYRGSGPNKGYEIQAVVVGVDPLRIRYRRVKSSPPRTGVNVGAWT